MTLRVIDAWGSSARGAFLKDKWRLSGRPIIESFDLALGLSLSLFPQFKALKNMITYEHLTGDASGC